MNQATDYSKGCAIVRTVRHVASLFRVKREERVVACAALLYAIALNVMVIARYWQWFSQVTDHYRQLVLQHFHISGYDPITYWVLNEWTTDYNIYRHPLLAFFMWIPAQANQLLIHLTGINFAQVITAVLLVLSAFYSVLFLYRILRHFIGLTHVDTCLLTLLFLSFGYTMVSMSVPDHFSLSTTALLLTLYVAGKRLKDRRALTGGQTLLLFLLTAGISLNNGIKVFLASWGVNGKRFFRPAHLLLIVILPSALLWGFARWEWHTFERPRYIARQEAKAAQMKKERTQVVESLMTSWVRSDTTGIGHTADSLYLVHAKAKEEKRQKQPMFAHQGKPMAEGEFASWTDATTPRLKSIVENLLGEPILLHADHLLGDVLVNRPVIVPYRHPIGYLPEAIVTAFFLAGCWIGRRSRLLWIALSWMACDVLIHVVLGFGLNEVYIMSPHWLFVLPIAMAYALRRLRGGWKHVARATLLTLSATLLAYNGASYVQFLFF